MSASVDAVKRRGTGARTLEPNPKTVGAGTGEEDLRATCELL